MKQDFINHVDYQYLDAIDATAGVLVNKVGREAGIDGYHLFTGPRSRAEKYASEELLEFWDSNPRLTMSEYENQWTQGREFYQ
jgi:hypothetical protein